MHPALQGIRLAVYDLDGTLIDSAPDLTAAVDATLTDRGLPGAGIDNVRRWVGNGSQKLVERALAHATGSPPSAAELDAAHAAFLEHYGRDPCAHTVVYDGVVACLDALRASDIVQVLVTNKPEAFLSPILGPLGLADYFALTLGGDSLAQKKPHPQPLLHAAHETGIAPANALMIGDSRNDVRAGKAAGFRTLAVSYGYNHGEPIGASEPDFVVDSLAELL